MTTRTLRSLDGRRILVVEDEFLIADDLCDGLAARGAVVVGPAPTVGSALELVGRATRLDGAVLDINLGGEPVFPVAEALLKRRVPFLFTTGYDAFHIPPRFATAERYMKPVKPAVLAAALFGG
ncbi:MAG: response regulator [Caenispirillum bisanense]|nr:response regulator [Caenispirillum bisanense]MCA1975144.1 response regulator [Caenispirillum sp.]